MKKLLVLGSSNIDHVVQVSRFPQPGETLAGSDYQVHFGGKGANQAVAAARAGGDVGFISCLGNDPLGLQLKQALIDDGIESSGICCIDDLPSGIAMIQVSADGENQIVLAAGANAALNQQRVTEQQALLEQSDMLLMQLETPLDGIIQAATLVKSSLVKSSQRQVALNPAPARALPADLYPLLDWITPNQTEAELLSGIAVSDQSSANQAAQWFHQQGVNNVIITMGAQGVWISQKNNDSHFEGYLIPGFKVDVVDTTAAGDTFNGAFFIRLLAGDNVKTAARFAHAAAAITVSNAGAQTSIPKENCIRSFLENSE